MERNLKTKLWELIFAIGGILSVLYTLEIKISKELILLTLICCFTYSITKHTIAFFKEIKEDIKFIRNKIEDNKHER